MIQTIAYVLCYFPTANWKTKRITCFTYPFRIITFNSFSLSSTASSLLPSGLTIGNRWVPLRGFRCGTILLGRLVMFHSSTGLVHFVYCLRLFPLDVNINGWPEQNKKEVHFCCCLILKLILLSFFFTECWND